MIIPPVHCDEHDVLMVREEPALGWRCPVEKCNAWLPDEEVYRLLSASPEPVPDIWVT
jgi:hypothetical protein